MVRCVHRWWSVDRIRTRASEGQLLRLHPGDLFHFEGHWWTIDARTMEDGVREVFVRYRCHYGCQAATLDVHPPRPFGCGKLLWSDQNETRALHASELDAFATTP